MKSETRTAARVLDVFETFGASRAPLSVSEIARAIGAPVSSCHALIRTLQGRGYLYSTTSRHRLYPTKRLHCIAQTIAEHDALLERVAPVLGHLRDQTRETAILGKRDNHAAVYLEVMEGLHTVRYTSRAGEHKPLHSSAIGKALLGMLEHETLAELLRVIKLPAVTAKTLTDPLRLHTDLRESAKRGYFITRGENVADVMAIAVSLLIDQEAISIAVAGPIQRMEDNLETYVQQLQAARQALSSEHGG
jgi:IclR family transcriptional regulator, acetate operon repressor